MQIALRGKRQRLRLAVPIYPDERPRAALATPGDIRQIYAGGNIEVGNTGVSAHLEALQNRERLALHAEAIGIEANRQDLAAMSVNQMSGRVTRVGTTLQEDLLFPGARREGHDARVI